MIYNITNISEANGFPDLYIAVNQLSNGFLTGFVLLALFILILLMFRNYPIIDILVGDSFVITILALLCLWIGWIGWAILIAPLILFFLSLGGYLFMKD